jgi:putative colanic acid biosynthesis UDP-glucose lipid carrier transferase
MQSLQILFFALDLLFLNVAYMLAAEIFEESTESALFLRYIQYQIVMNFFWIILSWMGKVYSKSNLTFFNIFVESSLKNFFIWTFLIIVYLFLPRKVELSHAMVFTSLGIFLTGITLNRFVYLGIREWIRRNIQLQRKILILGYNSVAEKLASFLEMEGFDLEIAGFVDDKGREIKPTLNTISGRHTGRHKYPVYTGIDEAISLSKKLQVQEIFSTIMPENNAKVYKVWQQSDRELIRFRFVPDLSNFVNRPVHIDNLRDIFVLSVRREPLENIFNRWLKRTFDIVVSSLVTIFILSWLFPLLGLLIYLESPGPIVFVQQRSGKNNKPFGCYKFRSMTVNNTTEATQATKNDKRVTRIGKFIRKTSLDEFPQFLNVLKGEMSIIGPRPHMLQHTENFSNMEEQYMVRQFLKPGITGWAQVNGYRGEIRELAHIKKRVEYDLWYLENWSLWLDIRIVFLTVFNVFKGEENAY